MNTSIRINLNDIKSIKIVNNGRHLDHGVIFIGRDEGGELIAGVIAEDGELYNVDFTEEDQIEIVVELKEFKEESINFMADEGM